MNYIGIDPGPTESAIAVWTDDAGLKYAVKESNHNIRARLRSGDDKPWALLVEFTKPYTLNTKKGNSYVPLEVVQAAMEAGRMIEAFQNAETWKRCDTVHLVTRQEVKKALLGRTTGTDKDVRDALIDRYGGRDVAIGGVRCKACNGKGWVGRGRPECEACRGTKWLHPPGPLNGFAGDCWAALAVIEAYRELLELPNEQLALAI